MTTRIGREDQDPDLTEREIHLHAVSREAYLDFSDEVKNAQMATECAPRYLTTGGGPENVEALLDERGAWDIPQETVQPTPLLVVAHAIRWCCARSRRAGTRHDHVLGCD